MANFSDLPVEIQEQILEHNPEMSLQYQYVNTLFRSLSSRTFYDKYCYQPVSQDEINNYLDTNYDSLGIVTTYHVDKTIYRSYKRLDSGKYQVYSLSHEFTSNQDRYIFSLRIVDRIERGVLEPDILTTARILATRTNCMQIDPDYVQTYLLSRVDEMGPIDIIFNTYSMNLGFDLPKGTYTEEIGQSGPLDEVFNINIEEMYRSIVDYIEENA